MNMKKSLVKLSAVSLVIFLLLAINSGNSFAEAQDALLVDEQNSISSTTGITNNDGNDIEVDELEEQLVSADSRKDIEKIMKNADDDVVMEYYDSLMSLNIEIMNELTDAFGDVKTEADMEECADSVEEQFDDIENIECSIENTSNDVIVMTYNIELEQGEIELSVEDGSEVESANTNELELETSSFNGLLHESNEADMNDFLGIKDVGYYGREVTTKKEYGDRYTNINNKSTFVGYPTSYFKFRIGYTLYKNRKIAGRYITAYEHEAGQAALTKITTAPIASSKGWDKKAKNSTAIKAHCSYLQKFYGGNFNLLTYRVKINYSVTPTYWDSKGALIKAKSTIDSVKLA